MSAALCAIICENNEEALMKALQNSNCVDLNQKDQSGSTPLLLSLQIGNLLFAKVLLENGAQISATLRVFLLLAFVI
jgi:ankyrin repeat protein